MLHRPVSHGADLPLPQPPKDCQQDTDEKITQKEDDYNQPTTSQVSAFPDEIILCDEPHRLSQD